MVLRTHKYIYTLFLLIFCITNLSFSHKPKVLITATVLWTVYVLNCIYTNIIVSLCSVRREPGNFEPGTNEEYIRADRGRHYICIYMYRFNRNGTGYLCVDPRLSVEEKCWIKIEILETYFLLTHSIDVHTSNETKTENLLKFICLWKSTPRKAKPEAHCRQASKYWLLRIIIRRPKVHLNK